MTVELPTDALTSTSDVVLVTGANGFIGARLVSMLVSCGFTRVRCLVRSAVKLDRLREAVSKVDHASSIEIVQGDLLSRVDCMAAAADVTVAYHLAAGTEKSFGGAYMNSAIATRNLMDALIECGHLKRFVSVSSFAVYSNAAMPRGALLDESAPLENASQKRYDAYGFGKLKQEEIVRAYGAAKGVPFVILRPGAVFGPGKPALSGRVGVNTFGFFVHVGHGNLLPLTYVDNCAEAILLAGLVPGIEGETYNVVDDDLPTSSQFLAAHRARAPKFLSVGIPYFVAYALSALWEDYSIRSKGQLPPVFNRRRCMADWKGNRYSNAKLREALRWRPRIGMKEAIATYVQQFDGKTS